MFENELDWNDCMGRDLGNVTLVKELGRGVMGVVFQGFQKSLKRQVAVKLLMKSKCKSTETWQLFRDEGEALAILNHPNIVPIFEMGEADDCFFQVMQLVGGGDLRTLVKRNLKHPIPSKRLLPLTQTIDIVLQMLDGLSLAHENGIIHQDVKPANVLLDGRGNRPLIADFGIARIFAAEYLSSGKSVGTPLYMSPEQAGGLLTDGSSDLYSVGVIMFEMIVGTLPIKEEGAVAMIERKKYFPESFFIKKPREVSSGLDPELERIVLKAIAPDRAFRYETCGDFMKDLKTYRHRLSFRTGETP